MKFKIFTFIGSDSDGHFANIFGDESQRNALVKQAADEAWPDNAADEELSAVYTALPKERPDDPIKAWGHIAAWRGETYDADTLTLEATPIVPQDAVLAARAAVEALAFARDCLKAAGADRAADKVRLALSSAKGAVRHAEGKAVRS